MAPSKKEQLKTLILGCTDPARGTAARLKSAKRIAREFPYHELIEPLADMAVDPTTPTTTVSFIMRVLYVGLRKWPSISAALDVFARIVGTAHLASELRTQALLHLLLLDLDKAEHAAETLMPEMLPLVKAERQCRTILEDMRDSDAPFNEAVTKILFF